MAENTLRNNSENGLKKWATSIEDIESPNGRTGDECGTCEAVEGEEDRAAGCRPETPQSQGLQHYPRAQHSGHDPVAIPTQSQEKSELLEGKKENSSRKTLDALHTQKRETEMQLQILRRRSRVIHDTSNHLKQEVSEQYDAMRRKLDKDEQETIEIIEENSRIAVGKLNRAIKEGNQHLEQICKLIKIAGTELQQNWTATTQQVDELREHSEFNKKTFAREEFEINKSKLQNLLKLLKNISEKLQAKLLQKSLLLGTYNKLHPLWALTYNMLYGSTESIPLWTGRPLVRRGASTPLSSPATNG